MPIYGQIVYIYRGYERDIIIIPGSYAGTPTEWQKNYFLDLTVLKYKQKSPT